MKQLGLAVMLLLAVAACSGGVRRSSADRNLISSEELRVLDTHLTAREVVRRLRPTWLEVRGAPSLRRDVPVAIYVNRQRAMDGLDRHTVAEISEIQYLNAIDATMQFGTDHGSGAILISLRGRS